MRNSFLFILILAAVALASCSSGISSGRQGEGDTLTLKYARLLTLVDYGDYRTVSIADPWKKGRILHTYVLVADTAAGHLPEGTVVKVPLRRTVAFSTTHAALMADLGRMAGLCGLSDVRYVKREDLRRALDKGDVKDVGNGFQPDIEKIIDLSPDGLLVSPFENSGGYGKLEELQVPVIECADYMESSPLARAEWMRFFGMLFGCEATADSLFEVVEMRYDSLKAVAAGESGRPKVMVDLPTSGMWYVPGGRSTIGEMIADAGGDYCFGGNDHSGSVPMAIEKVLDRCEQADIWLFRYGGTAVNMEQLAKDNAGFRHLKAFGDSCLYGCSTERSTFYESTPFRPDFLLEDFIGMFHSGRTAALRFFERIN